MRYVRVAYYTVVDEEFDIYEIPEGCNVEKLWSQFCEATRHEDIPSTGDFGLFLEKVGAKKLLIETFNFDNGKFKTPN